MRRIASFGLIVLFLAMSVLPLAAMPFYQAPANAENRVLQRFPSLTEGGSLNTAFFSELTDFVADRFAFRTELVHAHERLSVSLLGCAANQKVIVGQDGWLYFRETLNDYVGATGLSDGDLRRLDTVLALQEEALNSRGIAYLFTVAPNKNSVYPEYMPERLLRDTAPSAMQRLLSSGSDRYVDLFAALSEKEGAGHFLYYRTDSHWNGFGARLAYDTLMQAVSRKLPGFSCDNPIMRESPASHIGDLQKMLYPLDTVCHEDEPEWTAEKRYTGNFRAVSDIHIHTQSETNGLRLLMFRDSFGDALVGLFSNAFGNARYSKETPISLRIAEEELPDIVIQEIAQRNLPLLLTAAPVMEAPVREAAPDGQASEGVLFRRDADGWTHLYGTLSADSGAYRVLVTVDGVCREAFPITEQNAALSPGVGFSLYWPQSLSADSPVTVTVIGDSGVYTHTFS